MGASNWAVCPICRDRAQAAAQARLDRARAMYGQLGADEFTAAVAAAQADAAAAAGFRAETFREDHEIYGAETGTVTVGYSGHCTECSAGLDFTEQHIIPLGGVS